MPDIEVDEDHQRDEWRVECNGACNWTEYDLTPRTARSLAKQHVYHTGHMVKVIMTKITWYSRVSNLG